MINPFINLTSSFVGTKFNIKQSLIRAFFILPLLLSVTACGDDADTESTENTNTENTADTTPPVITLNGADEITLEYNSQYEELGATALDDVDGSLTVEVNGSVDVLSLGSYLIIYTATDNSDNSITETRQVTVVDTTAPIITLVGDNSVELLQYYSYEDLGVTVYDEYDDDVTVTQTNDIDNTVVGSYTVTYSAIDSEGNEASSVTQKVDILEATPFITTWKTTEANEAITVPTFESGYNYLIDWGDGSAVQENQTGDATHVYASAGTYTVSITGAFPQLYLRGSDESNRERLISVEQWGNTPWRSMKAAFNGAINLIINATDTPVLTDVESMDSMFYGSTNFNSDINHWDVSYVTDMTYMFSGAAVFDQPLDSWDVSNVTDMWGMFEGATAFNQPLDSWDVSNVRKMGLMFKEATNFNSDISHWDVSNVGNMRYMFYRTTNFNQDINDWDVSNVEDMSYMFDGATVFNQPLDNWDVSNVRDMAGLFGFASAFNQPLDNWTVSNVTGMEAMFKGATAFNQPLDSWDVSNVTDMTSMFEGATAFNQPLDSWDVSNVADMIAMFRSAESFNQSLGSWDVSSVTDMSFMFYGATTFNQPLDNWNVSSVTDMSWMFLNATTFNQTLESWDVSSVTNMHRMFRHAAAFNQNVGNWDVSNVADVSYMFDGSGLSSENYDSLLNGWSLQILQRDLILDVSANYSSASEAARQLIMDAYHWAINDDGLLVE
ncbi:BspA family leucine-rich repeat surface protein [uncultured Psychrosphaera sp.]|uniref:BspA family leucine-rich repeat surface protein n=1 Tax=uncultured Psychrosphaera sp. TaxID=1403522 RepID=UPI002621ADCF|nr:BspA family leucine-rich repeat surface protein [uncultured Psychrosphaera sp.]